MDNDTLKSIIIELRDSGYTFEAIANSLNRDFGVIMSRQMVHGLYQRTINKRKDLNYDKEMITDILNIYCLGYNMSKITEIINSMEYKTTYNIVREIVNNSNYNINQLKRKYIWHIKHLISQGYKIDDIRIKLVYKDVEIVESKFIEYVIECHKSTMKILLEEYMAAILEGEDSKFNRNVIRQLTKDNYLDIDYNSIVRINNSNSQ